MFRFRKLLKLRFYLFAFLKIQVLIVPHYDLQPISKDHNGNKGNHFLFFVLSLVLVSKPLNFASVCFSVCLI